jgi:DNA repair protein RadC
VNPVVINKENKRLIFASALKAVATSIILIHNHPSGALKPSYGDTHITQTLGLGGDILNIAVRDQLIISSCGYYFLAGI